MYTEFIIIYVLLVLILILLGVNLIFTIKKGSNKDNDYSVNKVSKNVSPNFNSSAPNNFVAPNEKQNVQNNTSVSANDGERIVFCTKCATPFPSGRGTCPNCGTPRA